MAAVRVAAALALAALSSCSSASSGAGSSPPAVTSTTGAAPAATAAQRHLADWPTYHGSVDRAGVATGPVLGPNLRIAWRTPMDAALYAQPIVASGLVVAATENNTVYAVDPATGRPRWQRHLASPARSGDLPCGNIDPSGITGTPAYDAATHQVFVVTEDGTVHHTLFALDVRDGHTTWQRSLDVLPNRDPRAEQERGAVLVTDGRVYVAFGGRYGDCGNYVGYVTGVAVNGTGPTIHYDMPTARQGGIWAAPGPIVGPSGDIYVASGNGAETGGRYDGSDSVVRLSPTLQRVALWAPTTWPQDNAQDLDLGSMSPVAVQGQIVIAGKRGLVYLLAPDLRGVGGEIARLDGCAGYGGAVVQGATTPTSTVLMPCDDGVRALQVQGTNMRWVWQNHDVRGSPLIAGDVVYGFHNGDLVEAGLADGRRRAHVHVGDVTRFATPVPAGNLVVVGTTSDLVAVTGG